MAAKIMLVLGIETSCDETAAAVLEDGTRLLSSIIHSQDEIHSRYGGIVPELAGRSHVERIHHVVASSLAEAEVKVSDIDLIAVTMGPGYFSNQEPAFEPFWIRTSPRPYPGHCWWFW